MSPKIEKRRNKKKVILKWDCVNENMINKIRGSGFVNLYSLSFLNFEKTAITAAGK
jgi:hypothetical protein